MAMVKVASVMVTVMNHRSRSRASRVSRAPAMVILLSRTKVITLIPMPRTWVMVAVSQRSRRLRKVRAVVITMMGRVLERMAMPRKWKLRVPVQGMGSILMSERNLNHLMTRILIRLWRTSCRARVATAVPMCLTVRASMSTRRKASGTRLLLLVSRRPKILVSTRKFARALVAT